MSPALQFRCDLNPETKIFEMSGYEPYENILVYGETINETRDVLEKEILPILWEEYVNGNAIKLSPEGKENET